VPTGEAPREGQMLLDQPSACVRIQHSI
jgi:hypothetical protein